MELIRKKGVTLIELLIALAVSSLLIAALYRTFIGQHKTYLVQEQVVDMQQNVRVAIQRMMGEIRMAGFGNIAGFLNLFGGVNGFAQVITPSSDTITVIGGLKQIRRANGDPILISSGSGNQVTLNYASDEFDKPGHQYISIGGLETHTVIKRNVRELTLGAPLQFRHPPGTPIFKVQAVTYSLGVSGGKSVLRRNENTGGGAQPMAENIDSLKFEYFDAGGALLGLPMADPGNIRMVRVTVTAKTKEPDPDYRAGDGFRRRQIASNIQVRNTGLSFE